MPELPRKPSKGSLSSQKSKKWRRASGVIKASPDAADQEAQEEHNKVKKTNLSPTRQDSKIFHRKSIRISTAKKKIQKLKRESSVPAAGPSHFTAAVVNDSIIGLSREAQGSLTATRAVTFAPEKNVSTVYEFPDHLPWSQVSPDSVGPDALKSSIAYKNWCLPFERMWEGKLEFGDRDGVETKKTSSTSSSFGVLPPWINQTTFRKGQAFATKYLYEIFYCHVLGLLLLLGHEDLRRFRASTGKSETPSKAGKRYLATFLQLTLWYEHDIESKDDAFFRSINRVRDIHRLAWSQVHAKGTNLKVPVLVAQGPQGGQSQGQVEFSPKDLRFWDALQEDITSSEIHDLWTGAPTHGEGAQPSAPAFYFSQWSMALTQWSFVAIPIMFPRKVGLGRASNAELAAFIHVWAVIGYLLGIKDQFNICLNMELESCRKYCSKILGSYLVPGLLDIDYETKVMWTALLEGVRDIMPEAAKEKIFIKLLQVLGVKCRNLKSVVGGQFGRCMAGIFVKPWSTRGRRKKKLLHGMRQAGMKEFGCEFKPGDVAKTCYY